MKNTLRFAAILGMALFTATTVHASEKQDGGWQASASWITGTGNDMKAMKDGLGYTIGLAYQTPVSSSLGLRFHLNSLSFDGVAGSGLVKARPTFFGGFDAHVPVTNRFSVYGGVIGVSWNQQKASSVANPNFQDRSDSVGTKISSRLDGTKAGVRFGVEYQIVESFSVNAGWTVCQANLAYNPSWLNVGVVYKF